MPTSNQFLEEDYSSGFEIEGVNIKQTVSESFNPFSGADIDTNSFQNTEQSLKDSNDDGRISLGCFVFDEDNIFSDEFPSKFRDDKFKQIPKQNLIINGSGKGVQSKYSKVQYLNSERDRLINAKPYLPTGTWGYCTFDALLEENKVRHSDLYLNSNLSQDRFEDYDIGQMHLLSFEQTNFTAQEKFGNNRQPDNHRTTGSSGWFAYFFDYEGSLARPQVHLDMIKSGFRDQLLLTDGPGELGQAHSYESSSKSNTYSSDPPDRNPNTNDCDEFFHRLNIDSDSRGTTFDGKHIIPTHCRFSYDKNNAFPALSGKAVLHPNIAKWIETDEAYSHGKCLEFMSVNTVQPVNYITENWYYTRPYGFEWDGDMIQTDTGVKNN